MMSKTKGQRYYPKSTITTNALKNLRTNLTKAFPLCALPFWSDDS